MLLIDGAVAGVWKYKRTKDRLNIEVDSFRKLSGNEVDLVENEARSLGEFTGTETRVEFAK